MTLAVVVGLVEHGVEDLNALVVPALFSILEESSQHMLPPCLVKVLGGTSKKHIDIDGVFCLTFRALRTLAQNDPPLRNCFPHSRCYKLYKG